MDQEMMRQAIAEAQKALVAHDVPIGAVVVINGEIVARTRS